MKRKVIINLVESHTVNNNRLVEYFASKIKERGIENGIQRNGNIEQV